MTQRKAPEQSAPNPLGGTFLRVAAGQTVSAIGSMISGVGVAVFVYLETGDAVWLGVLSAVASAPFVLVGPVLGWIDRFPRRRVMIGADLFAVLGPAMALVVAVAGEIEVWHLVLSGAVAGLGTAVQTPAFAASVPSLVERDAIDRANGLVQLGPAIGIVVGPAVATALVSRWGVRAVLLADLGSFAVAIGLTLASPFSDRGEAGAVVDDRSWRSALAWLRASGRPLIALLGVLALVNFVLAFFNLSLLMVATSVAGESGAGLLLAAGGVAMVVGSLVTGGFGLGDHRIRLTRLALLVIACGMVLVGIRPLVGVVAIGVMLALAPVPVVNATISTIFNERVPLSMQGRVFGLRSALSQALHPIGAIVAGLFVGRISGPLLEADGALAPSVGSVIGVGAARGAAFTIVLAACAVGLTGAALGRSRSIADLDLVADDASFAS